MLTWTDDDGVTHVAKPMVTACYRMVHSDYKPCIFDDPPRMLTCMACVAGGGPLGALLDYLEEINKVDDMTKAMEDAEWYAHVSKIPMSI